MNILSKIIKVNKLIIVVKKSQTVKKQPKNFKHHLWMPLNVKEPFFIKKKELGGFLAESKRKRQFGMQ